MHLDEPLIDALREHGATDEHLKLLRNADAVKYLLETLHHEYDGHCVECSAFQNDYERSWEAHTRDCKVMLGRIALGQHKPEDELEAAENEARREHDRRSQPPRTPNSWAGRITMLADPRMRDGEVRIIDSARFMEQFNDAAKEAFKDFDQRLYENNPLTGLIGRKK